MILSSISQISVNNYSDKSDRCELSDVNIKNLISNDLSMYPFDSLLLYSSNKSLT